MARRSRRRRPTEHVPLDLSRLRGMVRTELGQDGHEYSVRAVRGSEKEYRCPGCQQLVAAHTEHVVVWPADHLFGSEAAVRERRHWHHGCWQRLGRR